MGRWQARVEAKSVKRALQAARELANGQALMPRILGEVDRAMMALQGKAASLAPVAEGTLRGSATAWAKQIGPGIQSGVEFGGMASAYASVQHEHTEFRHTLPAGMSRTRTKRGKQRLHPIKGYRGGQAHFLYGEDPQGAWERMRDNIVRNVDRRVERAAEEALGRV